MITIPLIERDGCMYPATPLPTEGVLLYVYGQNEVTVYMEGDELPPPPAPE